MILKKRDQPEKKLVPIDNTITKRQKISQSKDKSIKQPSNKVINGQKI